MSLACYCNSHHHFRADHPVAGCLVSGCDCQAMSGGEGERSDTDAGAIAAANVIYPHICEVRSHVTGERGSHTRVHFEGLRDAIAAAQAAQTRALREALEEAMAECHAEHGDVNSPKWVPITECREPVCVRARAALTSAPREPHA